MPTCLTHGEYYPPDRTCHRCDQENIKAWKASVKAQAAEYKRKQVAAHTSEMTRLKLALQRVWRAKIFPYYQAKGLTSHCWIMTCKSPRFIPGTKHIMGVPHVSHYFPKGRIWQLWFHPVNSGICCYNDNMRDQSTVPEMESTMIKAWGLEGVQEMKALADHYSIRINTGQDRRHPTKEWLIGAIEYVKKSTVEELLLNFSRAH